MLREVTRQEIVERQNECRRLFLTTVGDREQQRGKFVANPQVTFRTAMRILKNRVAALHEQRIGQKELLLSNDA